MRKNILATLNDVKNTLCKTEKGTKFYNREVDGVVISTAFLFAFTAVNLVITHFEKEKEVMEDEQV